MDVLNRRAGASLIRRSAALAAGGVRTVATSVISKEQKGAAVFSAASRRRPLEQERGDMLIFHQNHSPAAVTHSKKDAVGQNEQE